MSDVKECACGNKIDEANMGEGATQCEWCEDPEPPMYKINHVAGIVALYFLNGGDANRIEYGVGEVFAYAPSYEAAKAIYEDYMEQEGSRNVGGSDQD